MAETQAILLLRKQLRGAWTTSRSFWTAAVLSWSVQCPFPCRVWLCLLCSAELTKNPVEGFSAGLVDDSNLFEWQVTIIGPPDTL